LTPDWCTLCGIRGRPKSDAGFGTVAVPSVLVAVVGEHLADFPPSDPEDLIFKGPKGPALRRNNFHRSVRWPECVAEAGGVAHTCGYRRRWCHAFEVAPYEWPSGPCGKRRRSAAVLDLYSRHCLKHVSARGIRL
jgi:hypothetical protein